MKIRFNEEGGYLLVKAEEKYPDPENTFVMFDMIEKVIRESTSLCLDDETDRQQLLYDIAAHARDG